MAGHFTLPVWPGNCAFPTDFTAHARVVGDQLNPSCARALQGSGTFLEDDPARRSPRSVTDTRSSTVRHAGGRWGRSPGRVTTSLAL